MWSSDRWFVELKPGLKLLFIYLFSNERASMSGLYEIPLRVISFETGLDKEAITQGIEQFQKEGKICYDFEAGVVWVKNMMKYQSQDNPSDKVLTKIRADFAAVPDCSLKEQWLQEHRVRIGYREGKDTSVYVSVSSPVSSGEGMQGEGAAARAYERVIGKLSDRAGDELADAIDTYSEPWVLEAINRAEAAGAPRWKYVLGILANFQRDGGPKPAAARGARTNKTADSAAALQDYAREIGAI
jgi:hypothetical protein